MVIQACMAARQTSGGYGNMNYDGFMDPVSWSSVDKHSEESNLLNAWKC